jgi:hypothetical protein
MRAKHSSDAREREPLASATPRPREGELDLRRWSGSSKADDARSSKPAKEPVVAVLRAAAPDGRPRRDSNRPGANRTSSRRGKALPPYLRVVK